MDEACLFACKSLVIPLWNTVMVYQVYTKSVPSLEDCCLRYRDHRYERYVVYSPTHSAALCFVSRDMRSEMETKTAHISSYRSCSSTVSHRIVFYFR